MGKAQASPSNNEAVQCIGRHEDEWRPLGDSNPCCRRERAQKRVRADSEGQPGTSQVIDIALS